MWFSPPPRLPVVLAIGAATTNEQLGLSLRWCRTALDSDAARAFCDDLVRALRSVAIRV
jgi:hypothetical protein